MSEDILEVNNEGATLYVTEFRGNNSDKSIQLTIKSWGNPSLEYILLSSKDVKKLIKVLQERLGE